MYSLNFFHRVDGLKQAIHALTTVAPSDQYLFLPDGASPALHMPATCCLPVSWSCDIAQESCDCSCKHSSESCDCSCDIAQESCDCLCDIAQESCDFSCDIAQESCDCSCDLHPFRTRKRVLGRCMYSQRRWSRPFKGSITTVPSYTTLVSMPFL